MSEKNYLRKNSVVSNSIGLEMTILGALLIDNFLLISVRKELSSKDFYLPGNKKIFESMCKLFDEHKKFDEQMICDQIEISENEKILLYSLIESCPTTANIGSYVNIVREKSVQRQLLELMDIRDEHKSNEGEQKDLCNDEKKKIKNMHESIIQERNELHGHLISYLRQLIQDMQIKELTEQYLHECIVQVNKAFILTLEHKYFCL